MPEADGGMGLDVKYAAVHWEEQAYANTTGPGFFLHSEIVAPYLVHYGTKEQKEQYLPRLCSGMSYFISSYLIPIYLTQQHQPRRVDFRHSHD